jgi:hypothetical protein
LGDGFCRPAGGGARNGVNRRRTVHVLVKPVLAGALLLLASGPAFLSHAQDRTRPGCHAPIKYRIGTVDPRFGITGDEFRRVIAQAGHVWESRRQFFQYDPNGKFRINLVYDTRQKFTQRLIAVRAGVSAKIAEADLVKDRLLPLRENFAALDSAYSDQAASYERAQDSYNQEVKRWNQSGGAPEIRNQELASERQSLRKQFGLLEASRQELNRAADELNALTKKRNGLLKLADAEANAFNSSEPASVQFEEGRYIREGREERIDIFQFENTDSLLVILAHELGHALGIKHNPNPASIMSPLIHTDRLALTAEDEDGVNAVCSRP